MRRAILVFLSSEFFIRILAFSVGLREGTTCSSPCPTQTHGARPVALWMVVHPEEGWMERTTGNRGFNLLDSSPAYSEGMPRRINVTLEDSLAKPRSYRDEWGLNRDYSKDFPSTVDQVVDEAFSAIAGTLYQTQTMDPNIASNAMSKSIFTQRPVRKKPDVGRIGLEIDGVEHLFPGPSRMSPSSAIRRVALLLAAKLSRKDSWRPFESQKVAANSPEYRTVTLCFNTIKQALIASNDLKRLELDYVSGPGLHGATSPYEKIKIQCIHDKVPKELHVKRSRRRTNGLSDGYVNATKGILLAVQPTDYNVEHKPPGPAIDAIGNFQKLVAQASVEEVPVIVLSPRFLSNESPYGGWDQSGYQQSATYGGLEPPKGPTPWIMRDFTPPVFCWVGDALKLQKPHEKCRESKKSSYLSRVAMTQSVMDSGHSWNIFVVKECNFSTNYLYLGSTRSASGRPTRAVLKQILEDC